MKKMVRGMFADLAIAMRGLTLNKNCSYTFEHPMVIDVWRTLFVLQIVARVAKLFFTIGFAQNVTLQNLYKKVFALKV